MQLWPTSSLNCGVLLKREFPSNLFLVLCQCSSTSRPIRCLSGMPRRIVLVLNGDGPLSGLGGVRALINQAGRKGGAAFSVAMATRGVWPVSRLASAARMAGATCTPPARPTQLIVSDPPAPASTPFSESTSFTVKTVGVSIRCGRGSRRQGAGSHFFGRRRGSWDRDAPATARGTTAAEVRTRESLGPRK